MDHISRKCSVILGINNLLIEKPFKPVKTFSYAEILLSNNSDFCTLHNCCLQLKIIIFTAHNCITYCSIVTAHIMIFLPLI